MAEDQSVRMLNTQRFSILWQPQACCLGELDGLAMMACVCGTDWQWSYIPSSILKGSGALVRVRALNLSYRVLCHHLNLGNLPDASVAVESRS